MPHISICIPTRNRISYLPNLFNSILIQKYKDFNVVISDNSDDSSVEDFIQTYKSMLPIIYHRNIPAISMAENWNMVMSLADGDWIKILHDDDWFSSEDALQKFADGTNGDATMVFCAYILFNETRKTNTVKLIKPKFISKLQKDPFLLFL